MCSSDGSSDVCSADLYQLEHSKRADALIGQRREILQAYQVGGTDTQRFDAIEGVLIADIGLLMAECDEHMAYAGRNYLPFLLGPYGTLRPLLFNCLEIMGLRAAKIGRASCRERGCQSV